MKVLRDIFAPVWIRWVVISVLFISVFMIIFYGQKYVQNHTVKRYIVHFNGKNIGAVSSPEIIDRWISQKQVELKLNNPQINMVLDSSGLTYKYEKAFKLKYDNDAAIVALQKEMTPKAIGVEMQIDNTLVGTVKDKETAENMLEMIKSKYLQENKVKILSAGGNQNEIGKPVLQSADFVQNVTLEESDTSPEKIDAPETLMKKLESGNVEPVKYTVQDGDCLSCIAQTFNIPTEIIYQNNPWIENDFIKIGQVLDLTVIKPMLSVKTIETRTDTLEIPRGIIYEKDDNMKSGASKIVTEGKNGLKKVTYRITKINGKVIEEVPSEEIVLETAVNKVVRQGTKVIPGIGSGTFTWPIYGPKLTSEFGKRWGKLHAGTDSVSSNRTIMAADNGKVIFAGEKSGYGNCIIIDHQNGFKTLYAHLSKIEVKSGQVIERGDKIGIMGSTGNSTGVHLHFEILKGDQQENPLKYLSK